MIAGSPLRAKSMTPVSRDDLLQSSRAVYDKIQSSAADDLLQSSQAVYDEIRRGMLEEIGGVKALLAEDVGAVKALVSDGISGVKRLLESRLEGMETEALIRLGKGIDGRVMKTLESCLEKRLDSMDRVYRDRMSLLEKAYSQSLSSLQQQHEDRLNIIQQSTEASMQRLELLLSNLQMPPAVVHVDAAEVVLPQQLPAEVVVNVSPAEVKSADVVVNVPPPRLTRKSFTYDDLGRPETILDQEVQL